MDMVWRLLVAIFLLCAALALGLFVLIFEGTVVAGICAYAVLALVPIGIIKGFRSIFFYKPDGEDKEETEE